MMMFQESALFPWLDVIENVLLALKLEPNLTRSERFEVAEFYLLLIWTREIHAQPCSATPHLSACGWLG
jgi:ABC-type nitrate/sulfonate/bicarbonate transport system ATPase subunit